MPVRAGRDNLSPIPDVGGEAGFENGLQRCLRVGGVVFPRAPYDAAHKRNAANVHSGKRERHMQQTAAREPLVASSFNAVRLTL